MYQARGGDTDDPFPPVRLHVIRESVEIQFIYFFSGVFILCIWVFCSVHACTPCACPVPVKARKKASNFLELELQVVVSHHVGAGNKPQVLGKSSECS